MTNRMTIIWSVFRSIFIKLIMTLALSYARIATPLQPSHRPTPAVWPAIQRMIVNLRPSIHRLLGKPARNVMTASIGCEISIIRSSSSSTENIRNCPVRPVIPGRHSTTHKQSALPAIRSRKYTRIFLVCAVRCAILPMAGSPPALPFMIFPLIMASLKDQPARIVISARIPNTPVTPVMSTRKIRFRPCTRGLESSRIKFPSVPPVTWMVWSIKSREREPHER